MTGFAQPPDPDDEPAAAQRAAAQPMLPDEAHPDQDDLDELDRTDADDDLPEGGPDGNGGGAS